MRFIRYFILISISLLSLSTAAFAGGYANFTNNSNANIQIREYCDDMPPELPMSATQKLWTVDRVVEVYSVSNLDTGALICSYSTPMCVPTGGVFNITALGCTCVGCHTSFLGWC